MAESCGRNRTTSSPPGERSTPTLSRKSKRTRGRCSRGCVPPGCKARSRPPAVKRRRDRRWNGCWKRSMLSQFAAVRAAHQAIASQGESPAWLGVLARGYGNLALLTNHYWNSLPEVFTARTGCTRSAWWRPIRTAIWRCGIAPTAWALGGTLLDIPLADLAELEQRQQKAAQSGAAASPPPSWAKLIAAYCKCDRSGVAQAGTDFTAYQPWATMLEFLLLRCAGEPHAMFNRAASPEGLSHCLLCLWRPVALWRSTDAGRAGAASTPEMFSRHVPESLSTLPGLPARVQSLVAAHHEPWGEPGGRTGRWRRVEAFSPMPAEAARRLRRNPLRPYVANPPGQHWPACWRNSSSCRL